MGRIRLLPDHVASQVAAGEVVERPASIVKELAENSLDAGATRVWVDFTGGGSRSLAVRDDGCGMDREDALLCLERHATSKIRTAGDLARVRTMGFRGEALPSISSVSRFRLLTREAAAEAGTEVLVEGGRVQMAREAGCAPGTLVEVRDLFFNVPARRKFVRGEETESAQIAHVLHAMAIATPRIGIHCRRDGRNILDLPPASSLDARLADLFGARLMERMVPLGPCTIEGIAIAGFIGKPGEGRRDRLHQFVALNGRPVASQEVAGALREACAGLLPPGMHPLAILAIEMDPLLADCNAHPTKRVVRFAKPDVVRRALFDAAQQALRPAPAIPAPAIAPRPALSPRAPELTPQTAPGTGATAPEPAPPATAAARLAPGTTAPLGFRSLGALGAHFFALEGSEGLVLLDVRSASERIAFERLLRQMERGDAPSQRLLLPELIEMPVREHAWIVEHAAALRASGFQIEDFGGATVKIEGVPAVAGGREPDKLLHEVATSLREAGRLPRGHGLREAVARSICRSAGATARPSEALPLLEELLRCELPYASPFGQPTMIQFSFHELERKFGRLP